MFRKNDMGESHTDIHLRGGICKDDLVSVNSHGAPRSWRVRTVQI